MKEVNIKQLMYIISSFPNSKRACTTRHEGNYSFPSESSPLANPAKKEPSSAPIMRSSVSIPVVTNQNGWHGKREGWRVPAKHKMEDRNQQGLWSRSKKKRREENGITTEDTYDQHDLRASLGRLLADCRHQRHYS